MVAKADQARVRDLIAETITLLCKNGLHFKSEFSIQALIGITLDQDEVFLVKIDETIAVSENGQTAADRYLISTDADSDEDTRHASSTTSKRLGNQKKHGYVKPELKCSYSTVSQAKAGSLWQHRNSQQGSMHDQKASILTDDAEINANTSRSCSVNESSSSQRRNQYQNETSAIRTTNTSFCTGRTGRRNVDSTELDLAKTLDNDSRLVESCTSNIDPSNRGHSNGNDLYTEIKEEPNDVGAYSFHAYQDQLLSNYNVASILHNQVLQPHLTADQSVIDASSSLHAHHHQLIQQELVSIRCLVFSFR